MSKKIGECGTYGTIQGISTYGQWIKCGDFLQTHVGNDHPRYPTIYFKCESCGKEGSL